MSRYLLDTNILLRLVNPSSSEYGQIRAGLVHLLEQEASLLIAPQSIYEFWNAATRPQASNGFGWSIAETARHVDALMEQFGVMREQPTLLEAWREVVVQHEVRGRQVHDARLVAAMRLDDIQTIVTLNDKDFERFKMIRVLHPRDIASSEQP